MQETVFVNFREPAKLLPNNYYSGVNCVEPTIKILCHLGEIIITSEMEGKLTELIFRLTWALIPSKVIQLAYIWRWH
jgi:hypothetical protein